MVAKPSPREHAFIVATDGGKPDAKARKVIRREVMKGKNKGRVLPPRRPKQATPSSFQIASSSIPTRVGSDLSFFLFSGEHIEANVLTPIVKFALEAKPAMFVLQSYFDFPRNPAAWNEALNSDPAYLNAVLSASHAYFDLLSGCSHAAVYHRPQPSRHLNRCLQLLRQRLCNDQDELRLADTTFMAIVCLTSYATRTLQDDVSYHHLKGLRELLELRGGIRSLRGNSKLLIETFRCDITLALNRGTEPIFFHDPVSEPFMPYLDRLSGFLPASSLLPFPSTLFIVDPRLQRAWDTTATFCSLVKYAAQENRTIPQDIFLNTMASVMYRLLAMNDLHHHDLDGALRLGLLGFCSRIFVQWTRMRVPHEHLSSLYQEGLLHLRATNQADPQLMLWLVFVGRVSIFRAEGELWLAPCIRDAITACGFTTWEEAQAALNNYLWLDYVYSESAETVFYQALSSEWRSDESTAGISSRATSAIIDSVSSLSCL